MESTFLRAMSTLSVLTRAESLPSVEISPQQSMHQATDKNTREWGTRNPGKDTLLMPKNCTHTFPPFIFRGECG